MSKARTTAAILVVLAGLVAPASAARAAEPVASPDGAPITRGDYVRVPADSGAEVDVLANDTDPDSPNSADLTICRVEPSDDPLEVYPTTDFDASGLDGTDVHASGRTELEVFPFQAAPGTYTFTYYVCDYDYLTPATLTVKVTAPQSPSAEVVTARPGYVRFENPGKRRTLIQYGSLDGRTIDGSFVLAPHSAKTVRVERHAIQWTATVHTRHGATSEGSTLTGIEQPARRGRQQQTPARRATTTPVDRTAWRLGTHQIELRSHSSSNREMSTAGSSAVESSDAPVTAPDTAEVSQGYLALADVLGNDSDPDGPADGLAICRASTPAGSGLRATPVAGDFIQISTYTTVGGGRLARTTPSAGDDPAPYTLVVQADPRTPTGTYEVVYYACDHQYLTPGTVNVTVTPSQVITARKVQHRPGIVRFTNPGPHGATVQIRSLDHSRRSVRRPPLIARFKLPAETSKNVRVRARQILWSASSRQGPGGSGLIGGIGRQHRR